MAAEDEFLAYNAYIEDMRREQYPMLQDAIYLDHAGTTLTSKLTMDKVHAAMTATLFGNPHSLSSAAQRTARLIDETRLRVLRFLKADPDHFEVVFTANATAAIKLVADGFRDQPNGFCYGYHLESHTSLVGVREVARESSCFGDHADLQDWIIRSSSTNDEPLLVAYPAQSNLNGRLLPLEWPQTLRHRHENAYVFLDAAAYAATTPLDLSDIASAPDFVALSFYKIFGFPDLGALIVRKSAAHIFDHRKYFGGGTTDVVFVQREKGHSVPQRPSHRSKSTVLQEKLEDGTLPYHSILALDAAMSSHAELFHSLHHVSRYAMWLARQLRSRLSHLRHSNGSSVTHFFDDGLDAYDNSKVQGPVVAFNIRRPNGQWLSNYEFEKVAFAHNVNVRTGTMCNPGGSALRLSLTPQELQNHYSTGYRCGQENDIMLGKPVSMIRVSLGAMSTLSDVDRFLKFIVEFFVASEDHSPAPPAIGTRKFLQLESLTIYPVKSCAGFSIPAGTPWAVTSHGLAWDREWCIVNVLTGKAMSQKRYPRLALIRPALDLSKKMLRVQGVHHSTSKPLKMELYFSDAEVDFKTKSSEICGAACDLAFQESPEMDDFLTECLGVACRLARFPAGSVTESQRHAKPHAAIRGTVTEQRTVLANESPILTITRASLKRLNETIKRRGGKAASPESFRANIILADSEGRVSGMDQPWAEDSWSHMEVGGGMFQFLGGCGRCQMVCIDQRTAEKNQEPFSTLAKTRRIDGRVLFGVHTALVYDGEETMISVGDLVRVYNDKGKE